MELECCNALNEFKRQRIWQHGCKDDADYVLHLVVQGCLPSSSEWQRRQAVIDRVRQVLAGMPDFQANNSMRMGMGTGSDSGCTCRLTVFGSFCSTLYHKGSDLDLTITGKWRNRSGQLLDMGTMGQRDATDMLFRIKRYLQQRQLAAEDPSNPLQVINARVPLVVYTDALTGIHVDISVCNHGGAFKSLFMKDLVNFDQRFAALYRLVKLWAETHNLNDPKMGTLNSWSITQMVVFHLQSSSPAILPPLWQLFNDEPSQQAVRPLQQQEPNSSNSSSSNSSSSSSRPPPDFSLLQGCQQQRRRYQGFYNTSSSSSEVGSSGSSERGLLELLAGFFVRYREVLLQWLQHSRHTKVKMSTWLGRWECGGSPWRQDYLVLFEDPFDASDNTARTLGTAARNDAGGWRLLDALDAAVRACSCLQGSTDLDVMLVELFHLTASDVMAPSFDPIRLLQQEQQRQQEARRRQQQQQELARQRQLLARQQQQQQQQLGDFGQPSPQQALKQLESRFQRQQQQQQQSPQDDATTWATLERLISDVRLQEPQQPQQQQQSRLLQAPAADWRGQQRQQQPPPLPQQVLDQQYRQHSVSGGANLLHRHAHHASSSNHHQYHDS